jgi:hypothetical protein
MSVVTRSNLETPAPHARRTAPLRHAVLFVVSLLAALPGAARAADFKWHGLLDLVEAERSKAFDYNLNSWGDGVYDAYRARLFVDANVNDRLQVLSQFVLEDLKPPYVDGAYLVYTPWADRDLHLMAGKLPWAIGTFGPRTYSNKNPLIGTPLLYQYHAALLWYEVVPNVDALLNAAGQGQYHVNYFGYGEGMGMPIVDDSYWDFGVTLAGSARPLEYSLGVSNGAPSWASTTQDDNSGKSFLGRVGLAPLPGLRFGVSGAYGPYMNGGVQPRLPSGHTVDDYHQKLAMADFEVSAGHAELRAEGAHNVWETPKVGDLKVDAGYVELKYSLSIGMFLAGRWDVERFGDVTDSSGVSRPWDWNVTRIEGGAGYRFTRDVTGKLTYQDNDFELSSPGRPHRRYGMLAGQLSVAF